VLEVTLVVGGSSDAVVASPWVENKDSIFSDIELDLALTKVARKKQEVLWYIPTDAEF
jgi:hypothetical protein